MGFNLHTELFFIPLKSKNALIVSDSQSGIEECIGLLKTLGGNAQKTLLLSKRRIDPATYIGKGKVEEIANILEENLLDLLLVDFNLSPSQVKNLEKNIRTLILDRSGIILEIFNQHARTKEAKLQVELARLEYLAPRLTHLWSHFERQRGAGGLSQKGKGMGEKQIEVDRRLIKNQISLLKKRLQEVEKSKTLHRRHRKSILKIALVGYTNAGKSTILNALTDSQVYVENTLFATLDASVKLLDPKSRPQILAIDTVGFIDRLPHSLVASFRSTLSEILEADLLIHVIDSSHAERERQFEVTSKVLEELKATSIPQFFIFNKVDCCKDLPVLKIWVAKLARPENLHRANPTQYNEMTSKPLYINAFNPSHIQELRKNILKYFENRMNTYDVVIPYENGKIISKLFEVSSILTKHNTPKGLFFRIKTMPQFAQALNLEQYRV